MPSSPPIVRLTFNGTANGTGTTPVTATLTNATYEPGRINNLALNFAGVGQAEVSPKVVPLSGSFTLCFWVKANQQPDGPSGSWLLYKFAGPDRWIYIDLASPLTRWSFIVLVQDGRKISLYLNGELRGQGMMPVEWGKPTGFCLVNDSGADSGFMTIEDLTLFPVADYSQASVAIPTPIPSMEIKYSVNGTDFKRYGIYVSASKGLLDNLDLKDPVEMEWPGYHGKLIDLSAVTYQARTITLSCFIKADGVDDFIEKVNAFIAQFQKPQTQRVKLEAYSSKPHVYEVYLPSSIGLEKKWSERSMFGTFQLTLVEPEPVKRVLSFGIGTVSVSMVTKKIVAIHWGDGVHTYDVFSEKGQKITVTHTYSTPGPHEIIISGVIEEITDFSSNAAILWNRL